MSSVPLTPPFLRALVMVALLVVLHGVTVSSYKTGAPHCNGFTPKHHTASQSTPSPYSIVFSPTTFKSGDIITVTIKGKNQENFKGFAIAARTEGTSDNYGSFVPVSGTRIIKDCQHNTALTHNSNSSKTNLIFNWTSPQDLSPGFFFLSTIVKNYTTFWTQIKTPIIARNKPKPPLNTWVCSNKFVCQVTWLSNSKSQTTSFQFLLEVTVDYSYIALGLSKDKEMGSDSVMECLYLDGEIKGQYSYNAGKHNSKVADLVLDGRRYVDNIMSCNFTRNNNIENSKIFNIGQEKWHLLMAAGQTQTGFSKKVHRYTASTNTKINFFIQQDITSEGEVEVQTEILTHLHGIFMIIAWVFFASVGMFAARYSKIIHKNLFKIMLWFQLHRIFMVLTLVFTVVGFILILIDQEGEYSDLPGSTYQAHPPLGIIVTILVICNPVMGYFRPGKDSPLRVIFNWCHRMVGVVAMVFADTTIFIGVVMHSKMEGVEKMYDAFVIEMSLFLVYKLLAICTMEILNYCKQGKISAYEMNTSGQANVDAAKANKNERIQMIMISIHTVICLAFTIALIATFFM